jgi:hypothetical protein
LPNRRNLSALSENAGIFWKNGATGALFVLSLPGIGQKTGSLCASNGVRRCATTFAENMKIKLILSLIVLAALVRLLPHPHNFTPLGAMGLFGAAYFGRRWMAFAVPFAALFLSDLVLNNLFLRQFYPHFVWITSVWIYAAFALVIASGFLLLRGQKIAPARVLKASLFASLIFFTVTNLSVWFESALYPQNGAGLLACFVAGLPFLGNTILGDLCFSAVLFGVYEWMAKHTPQTAALDSSGKS